jgi:PAS domain S-box-containing protein
MTGANTTTTPFGTSPWQRVPGLPELNALLNYITRAALIVDKAKGIVVGANHAFLLLTAFDIKEVVGQPAIAFLGGFSLQEAILQDQFAETLRRRMRDPISVTVQVRLLDGNSPYLLVLVNAEIALPAKTDLFDDAISNALTALNRLPQEESPEESIQIAAEIIRSSLDVGQVAVYQASPDDPNFTLTASAGDLEVFPDLFASSDMPRLSETQVWLPGKRMYVDLHRAARVHNLTYAASAPLGQAGMWVGVLVLGGGRPPVDKIEVYLDLYAAQLTRIIEHHLLVTELKRQISEAWQSLVVSQVVMDNTREGILLVSGDMKILEMNPAVEWMLGYAEWEVKGQPVENVIIGPDALVPALHAASRGIPTHNIGSVSLHRRNGQSFPAHVQTIPVGQEGQGNSLLVLITDDSEHEEIRQRTQQLEQRALLGEVTAVFAHEVRNPINNIYSALQVMAEKTSPGSSEYESIGRLIGDCMRLTHLMESVLNFSRTNKYSFERVDLQMLIRRLMERWRPRFSKVNVSGFFKPAENIPAVAGDARALEQVFTNLIGNAVEAMSKSGGNLAIRMEPIYSIPNRPQVLVTVSDDGPGIPDDIRERIFEPFVTTKSQGTGLGLAITKRIVTAHHGGIQVNTFPGGTMFEVTLLAYQEEE